MLPVIYVLMLLYAMFETKKGTGHAEVLSEQQLHVYDLLCYHLTHHPDR